jgi:NIPSNAP protein
MSAVGGILDIRTYRLRAGERESFERLFADVRPMLARFGISVVGAGPSLHDGDLFILVRRFGSLEERESQLSRFYGSEEWLARYDEPVTALIESYHVVVVPADGDIGTAVATAVARPRPA